MEKEEVVGEEGEMEEAWEVFGPRFEVLMLDGRVRLKVEVAGEPAGGVMVASPEAVGRPKDWKEEEEVGRERGLSFGRRVERAAARRVWRGEGWERGGAETEREQTLEAWPFERKGTGRRRGISAWRRGLKGKEVRLTDERPHRLLVSSSFPPWRYPLLAVYVRCPAPVGGSFVNQDQRRERSGCDET